MKVNCQDYGPSMKLPVLRLTRKEGVADSKERKDIPEKIRELKRYLRPD